MQLLVLLLALAGASAQTFLDDSPYLTLSFLVNSTRLQSIFPPCLTVDTYQGQGVITYTVENNTVYLQQQLPLGIPNPQLALRTYAKWQGQDVGISMYYMHSNLVIYAATLQSTNPQWGIENRYVNLNQQAGTFNYSFSPIPTLIQILNLDLNPSIFSVSATKSQAVSSDFDAFLLKNRTLEFSFNSQKLPGKITPVYHNNPPIQYYDAVSATVNSFSSTVLVKQSGGIFTDPTSFDPNLVIWMAKRDWPSPQAAIDCL